MEKSARVVRIMVVDDDDSTLQARTRLLIALGYVVIPAANGVAALEIFEGTVGTEYVPQIVITDFHMPEMNGLQFAAAILLSNSIPNSSIPTFVFTSGELTKTPVETLKLISRHVLEKPVRTDILKDVLYGILLGNH
jgi:CheY-like chemotaxis protein